MEIVFEVIQEQDGGFVADCLNENIFTQSDSWDVHAAKIRLQVL
jgi:hypothetical protein